MDERLRRLERDSDGSPEYQLRVLRERVRAGIISSYDIPAAAYFGDPIALQIAPLSRSTFRFQGTCALIPTPSVAPHQLIADLTVAAGCPNDLEDINRIQVLFLAYFDCLIENLFSSSHFEVQRHLPVIRLYSQVRSFLLFGESPWPTLPPQEPWICIDAYYSDRISRDTVTPSVLTRGLLVLLESIHLLLWRRSASEIFSALRQCIGEIYSYIMAYNINRPELCSNVQDRMILWLLHRNAGAFTCGSLGV